MGQEIDRVLEVQAGSFMGTTQIEYITKLLL
jgi:hypothetical protein